ncbi:MAG: nickel-responsive transcriptional regulator NikR [Planctomycetota bacterium]
MSDLARVSISLERRLLIRLAQIVQESGYTNRSEFVRDLVRKELVEREWRKDRSTLGTVTLVYNPHRGKLSGKLTELQHEHHDEILASTHVHLAREICAEVLIVRGRASRIRRMADLLRQQKGVLHAALSLSSTGRDLV